ncbi:methyltransferase domain-containing protein [Paractinoplanes globisporus]|uniref:Class I SAM-dependent methyltransferase n=1 Tax=Paractinoplanes globisporus TaxID=113565 RepID=A0ABW6WC55_9ACTN|nr:methyltransferase domain-containing protein [Actinoplanes globisporus]
MSAAVLFDAVFRRPAPFTVRHATGAEHRFDPVAWCRDDLPGDGTLLARCTGPTLDVGCGPGRLTVALAGRGLPALGIDISETAVRLARRRGATALRRDVFDPLPGTGRWQHVLLADGNIGIGGDPARLLRRCRRLVRPEGRVHVEAAAPGTAAWSGAAVVQGGGTELPWACVPIDDLSALAAATSMRLLATWTEAGRWFATLAAH